MNPQLDEIIDFRQFFFKIINNIHFFLLGILLIMSIAFLINRYADTLYYSETSVIIKEKTSDSAEFFFQENMSLGNNHSVENKILLLKSFPLIYNTLSDLNFDITYYTVGR